MLQFAYTGASLEQGIRLGISGSEEVMVEGEDGQRGPGGPTDLVIHSSVHTSDTYLLAKIHGSPQGAHIQWENKTQSQVNATGCRWTCAR